ncbi:MAG: GldG family protein [Deltaproteobacteria bacterium]|nr:GldG family protein [Deltaproteobacteria bacterium]
MSEATSERRSNLVVNLGRIAGAIGLVFWLSAPLTWQLSGEFGPLVWGKLMVGGLCVGAYLFTNADFWSRIAGSRSTGLLFMTAVSAAIVLALVGVANYIAVKNDKEFDLTAEGLYTLSEQTRDVLSRLDGEVKVMAFFHPMEPEYVAAKETLERYAGAGNKLTYEMIPPQNRPDLVKLYQITNYGPRIVITTGKQDARAKDFSEQELTNAVIKVTEQKALTVAFLVGHGELSTDDEQAAEGLKGIATAIEAEGYKVETLSLQKGAQPGGDKVKLNVDPHGHAEPAPALEVPRHVAVLVVAGPRGKLLPAEMQALEAFLKRGGRLVLLAEAGAETGIEKLARQWKIELNNDIVVDTNMINRLSGLGPAEPLIFPSEEGEHPATREMVAPAVFGTASTLNVVAGGEAGVDARPLLVTGESAWGETALKDGTAERDAKDHLGPAPVAAVAVKQIPSTELERSADEARLVVFGDADWVSNRYYQMQGNTDLFLNTLNWLAEQEGKITIRPKSRAASSLFLTGEQFGVLKFVSMDILPVLLVAAGLGIVLIRRRG